MELYTNDDEKVEYVDAVEPMLRHWTREQKIEACDDIRCARKYIYQAEMLKKITQR